MNIASFILGIVAITGWVLCTIHEALAFIPLTAAILAIVFGVIFRKHQKDGQKDGRGLATTGIVLGVVCLIVIPILSAFLWYSSADEPSHNMPVLVEKRVETTP